MVVCKYFMQGCCKFGDNCRYEHPRGGNAGYAYSAQRQLFGGDGGGSRYGGGGGGGGSNQFRWTSNEYQKTQQTRPVTQQTAPNELINSLVSEVKEWERNKMWPLSCIGFEKDSPCVPDLEDTSPEELRHLAYEAQKSNSFQGYVDYVKNLLTDFNKKRQMLSNPTMRTKQKLLTVIEDYRLRKNRCVNVSHNTMSLFSSPTTSESSFQSSGFGTSFGNDTTQNSFGAMGFGSSTSQGSGTSGMTGSFGSKSGSAGGFGSSGSFGANSGSSGAFGSGNAFGTNSKSSGVFGASGDFGASLGSSGGFGSGTSSGGFGTSSFGDTGIAPSVFGNSATTPAGLGTNSFSSTTSSGFQGTNPFGKSSSQTVDSTGAPSATFQTPRQAVEESSTYTPMNRLTAEELAEFQATHFTLGKIPTNPPPKELCF
ncbi:nucleoporin NUP42-like isoform X3 [Ostrea edulis]|uniref:nucleoporin NUP42-like isoform X3 n=1 Tax=Ostrea edulis TaxID=37623 RepID=UPI0024AEBA6B|nr:nucleoporin NUP42-like isoform X3 [Ostrea edulis]